MVIPFYKHTESKQYQHKINYKQKINQPKNYKMIIPFYKHTESKQYKHKINYKQKINQPKNKSWHYLKNNHILILRRHFSIK